MRLTELTGIPGSGKSYILNRCFPDETYTRLDNAFLDKHLYVRYFPLIFRALARESVCFFIGVSVLGRKNFIECALKIFSTDWKFFRKINVIRNITKRHALLKIATRQPNDNYVIDEGLFHFNFVFATSCVDCPGAVCDYTAYGIPEIAIVVASENNIVERLSNRGHNYIEDSSDESSIREFVALNEKVLVTLQSYLKEHGISSRIIEN